MVALALLAGIVTVLTPSNGTHVEPEDEKPTIVSSVTTAVALSEELVLAEGDAAISVACVAAEEKDTVLD